MKHQISQGRSGRMFVDVSLNDSQQGPVLSIMGEIYGPRRREPESVGQILNDLRLVLPSDLLPEWPLERVLRLIEIWEHWHLNNLRAGCEHQLALGWSSCNGRNPRCPITVYHGGVWAYNSGKNGVYAETTNGYTARYWYPEGSTTAVYCMDKIGQKCPECQYHYGANWLYEPLPADVFSFVEPLAQA